MVGVGLRKDGGFHEEDFDPAPSRVGKEWNDEAQGEEQPRVVHQALEHGWFGFSIHDVGCGYWFRKN